MDSVAEQMKKVMGALEDIKMKQSRYESNFFCDELVENSICSGLNNDQITDRPTSLTGDQCDKLIQLTALCKSIKRVEQKISNLKRDLKYVEIKLDNRQQYGRSNCIILHGSGIEQNETYGAFCEKATEKLNNSLKLTEKVTIKDIDIAHNLPSAGNKRNFSAEVTQGKSKPLIIIKFVRRSVRNDVFSQRNYYLVLACIYLNH